MDPVALLIKVLIAVFTFGVLVAIHEWGHFWVARRCGVKVLRFAIGFGTPLLRWTDKTGTEFAVCALPLGGYVKMLDEREGAVAASERSMEFNSKHPWRRIAIASAGPIANFMLAFVAFVVIASMGTQGVAPIVGSVGESTPSAKAGLLPGDEITRIDSTVVRSWQDAMQALMQRMGESGSVEIQVERGDSTEVLVAPLDRWLVGAVEPDLLNDFGISPYRLAVSAELSRVLPDSAADKAGIQEGDRVVEIDGNPVVDWYSLVDLIQPRGGKTVDIVVDRAGELLVMAVTPTLVENGDESFGRIGVAPVPVEYPPEMIREFTYPGLSAVGKAVQQVQYYSVFTLESFGKLLSGSISVKNLSGPISIAKVASDSAKFGLSSYLTILAILSISLGVLNLMPIPVLDGGHIVFHSIEWIKGSPVSEVIQEWSLRVGGSMVLCLMVFALYNDISRL